MNNMNEKDEKEDENDEDDIDSILKDIWPHPDYVESCSDTTFPSFSQVMHSPTVFLKTFSKYARFIMQIW